MNDTTLVLGTFERVTSSTNNLKDVYANDENIKLYSGANQIFAKVHEKIKENACFAIQEDFFSFKESKMSQDQAKLFLVDKSDYKTLEIFFDDQINE